MELVNTLVSYALQKQQADADAARRDDLIRRAATLLGYQGAMPNDAEIQSKLRGGSAYPAEMSAAAQNQRYAELAAAEDANRPQVEQYRLASAMDEAAKAGGGPKFADFVEGALRARMPGILQQLSARQQADALNQKPLGDPYQLAGGVMGNTETGEIAGVSPAVDALAQLRQRQTATESNRAGLLDQQAAAAAAAAGLARERAATESNRRGLLDAQAGEAGAKKQDIWERLDALQKIMRNPDASPLLAADVANKKQVSRPEMVRVKKPDGSTVMMTRTPRMDGGFDYAEAQDAQGQTLTIPAPAPRQSARQTEVQDIMDTYGLSREEALTLSLSDPATRAKKLRDLAKDRPARPAAAAAGGAADVIQQAVAAVRAGKDPDIIRQRLRAMGIDPSKAGL